MTGPVGTGGRVREARPGEPDVVVVGAASRDVDADDPRGWRLGGGVTYAALTSARLGVPTAAIIGLDPRAFESPEVQLLARAGVELLRVPLPHGPVFRNVESRGPRVQTCLDPGRRLPLVAVPAAWRDAPAWILAPVAGEIDDAWADRIPGDTLVALGWQGLLRVLRTGAPVARRAPVPGRLVARADLVSLSEHDVPPGTILAGLAPFLHAGAWIAVTAGAAGGQVAEVMAGGLGRIERYPAVPAEREIDATGAGDTFLAALVACLVRPNRDASRAAVPGSRAAVDARLVAAVRFAAAAASFTVEGRGVTAVPGRAAVLRRLAGLAHQSFAASPSSST